MYAPGMHSLGCEYCGHENPIVDSPIKIQEYDFAAALEALAHADRHPLDSTQAIKCPNCAACFELKTNQHAGDCPFCSTPVVISTEHVRLFQPKSLLPFVITQEAAQARFDQWIADLWFAPSALQNKARRDEKLIGIYVPYWTYDSHTDSIYHGQRGTVYYERRTVVERINGRTRQRTIKTPRVRWTPASGRVRQLFDDVLVGATRTLPRRILDSISPWDLDQLVSYNQAYLSGFQSEIYQVELDTGFQQARKLMERAIKNAVRRDIGGDRQQIHSLNTHHSNTTFKHILLPVWSAAFRYRGKTYRFIINGRTGRTQGERPYSKLKIGLMLSSLALGLFGMVWYLETSGLLQQMSYEFEHTLGAPVEYYYR